MENVNEEVIEELTATKGRKKAASDGKDRKRARRWTAPEIDQLSDLLRKRLLVECKENPLFGFATTRFLISTIIKYLT